MFNQYERRQLSSGFTAYTHTIDRVQSAHPASKNASHNHSATRERMQSGMFGHPSADGEAMMATTGGINRKRSTTGTLYGVVPSSKASKQQALVKGLANPILKYEDATRNQADMQKGYSAEMNHKRQVKSGLDMKSFDHTERTTEQPSLDDVGIQINDKMKHNFIGN